MALVVTQPFIRVTNNNGQPIVGAKLWCYEKGTTTERAIFFDADLTIEADNPLDGVNSSNARGEFPKVYTAQGEYKLRIVDANDVLIWEEDDLDTGMSAGSGALPIARGGTGATTAAAARANLDVPSNSELADLADDLSDIQTIVQAVVSEPLARLSLTSNLKQINSDVVAGTAVYATGGYAYPIWDGAQFVTRTSGVDLPLTLHANHVANGIYDNFAIWDSGALVHVTGLIWNTVTAGSGARGTGTGTTELELLNGLWVNKYAQTMRNGSTTYEVAARCGLYLGSTPIDGSNGQCSQHVSYGQNRRPGPWSAYSRLPRKLIGGDGTASWTYDTNTTRAANGSSSNKVTVFSGLPEEPCLARYQITKQHTGTTNGTLYGQVGIGLNSTTTFSGTAPDYRFVNVVGAGNLTYRAVMGPAEYLIPPFIGLHDVTALENGLTGTGGTNTWIGTETSMRLTAEWRA